VRTNDLRQLTETRATTGRIGELAAARKRPGSPLDPSRRTLHTNNAGPPRAMPTARGMTEVMSRAG